MTRNSTALPALRGRNPLGFLAALGTLDVVSRHVPTVRLSWSEGLRAEAVLHDAPDFDEVVLLIDADREGWQQSALLALEEDGGPATDLKPDADTLRRWYETVRDHGSAADKQLLQALLAEGAVAGNGKESKPTHLHFTAGQQRFLTMVRQLRDGVTSGDLREALQGPWRFESLLPSLGWDVRGQRVYAISGLDPSKEKRRGVPGADWLAFLGLALLPVVNDGGRLLTTGFSGSWKRGTFRWPLWQPPLTRPVVSSLITTAGLADLSRDELGVWGVSEVMAAPVRRSDQGGYGSFGPASSNRREEVVPSLLRPPPSTRAPRREVPGTRSRPNSG